MPHYPPARRENALLRGPVLRRAVNSAFERPYQSFFNQTRIHQNSGLMLPSSEIHLRISNIYYLIVIWNCQHFLEGEIKKIVNISTHFDAYCKQYQYVANFLMPCLFSLEFYKRILRMFAHSPLLFCDRKNIVR